MLIYIDTETGTWGIGEDNLLIFDATPDEGEMLLEMSDSEIIAWDLANFTRDNQIDQR